MIRPVIGTIATRVVVMAMTLLTIMVAGHTLGTEGLGTISLIVLGITFILLLNNVVGGGGLVFLSPRYAKRDLLSPAYIWAVITAIIAYAVYRVIPVVPEAYTLHVVILALVQSLYTIHFGTLLGAQRIRIHNLIVSAQAIVLFAVFAALVVIAREPSVMHYVIASYASFSAALLLSAVATRGIPSPTLAEGQGMAWRALFKHGGLIQLANFLQLLNYRIAYYLIEGFRGTSALGLYSVANQLAESAWLAPKSLGTVLYSWMSNTEDPDRQRDLTLTVTKASVAFSILVVGVLMLVPEPLFRFFFGAEIIGLPALVLLLGPGIVAMAASQAFSHYFSGTGRNVHNAAGSGIGLVLTLGAGYLLIPEHGLHGAALTASLAYCGNAAYQLIAFLRSSNTPISMLLVTGADVQRITRLWRNATGRSEPDEIALKP